MISHINILHKKSNASSSVINANALLGFGSTKEADDEEKSKYKGQKKEERPKL
jgi:hypothetical protein